MFDLPGNKRDMEFAKLSAALLYADRAPVNVGAATRKEWMRRRDILFDALVTAASVAAAAPVCCTTNWSDLTEDEQLFARDAFLELTVDRHDREHRNPVDATDTGTREQDGPQMPSTPPPSSLTPWWHAFFFST